MTKIQSSHGLCNLASIEKPLSKARKSLLKANLGITSLDSLKVRVPTAAIKNFDKSRLLETTIRMDSDGVVLSKKQRYKLDTSGFLIGLKAPSNNGKYSNTEELIIMFSSKLLGRRYFQGITKDNIGFIHAYIASKLEDTGVGFLSYSSFINGMITDVDIKVDMLDSIGFKAIYLKKIINLDGATRTMKTFSSIGNSSYKTGVQLSERTQGRQGVPFGKIYNKGIEMNNGFLQAIKKGTDDFYTTFPSIDVDRKVRDVWRIEFTMKNSSMLKANQLPNTLGGILDVSSQELYKVLEGNFYKWVKSDCKKVKKLKREKGLNADDSFILDAIKKGFYNLDSYLLAIADSDMSESTRKRKKRRFKELFQIALLDSDYVVKNSSEELVLDSDLESVPFSDLGCFCGGILYGKN